MKDLAQQIKAVDKDTLSEIVRSALGDGRAEIIDWSFQDLGKPSVPTTGGIYRFSGDARIGEDQKKWSLILKVLVWFDLSDWLGGDFAADPQNALYWKREALFYESDFFDGWDGELVPAQCYRVDERDTDSIWLWLEDVADEGQWNLERHILSARHLGQMNGAFVDTRSSSVFIHDFVSQYMHSLTPPDFESIKDPKVWQSAAVKRAFPESTADRVCNLLSHWKPFLDRVPPQSLTLCHQDCDRRNLFSRTTADGRVQTIAIDWGFVGLSPVGEDLGNQVFGNMIMLYVDPSLSNTYYDSAFEAYLYGLRDAGWSADENAIHLAAACQAMTYLVFTPGVIKKISNEEGAGFRHPGSVTTHGYSNEDMLVKTGLAIAVTIDVVENAFRTVGLIS